MAIINIQPPAAGLKLTATPNKLAKGETAYGKDGLIVGEMDTYEGETQIQVGGDPITIETKDKYVESDITIQPPTHTDITIHEMNGEFYPQDYGVDYFDKVTAQIENVFAKGYCSGMIPHQIDKPMLEGVTLIRDYAFQNDTKLTSAILADSITRTGYYTFYNTGITYFETGTGMQSIGERTATGCRSLVKVVLRGNNAIVGNYSFQNDAALEDVVLEEGISQIYGYAFAGCARIKPIVIPESCTRVLESAFQVDATPPSYLNREFYVLFKRRPQWNDTHTTLTVNPTLFGSNILKNRPRDNLVAFVPWDCFLVYSTINVNGMNNANAGIWDDCGGWIEAQEGQTLPTTNTETYNGTTKTYSYSWYKEPSMTTPVTVADEGGTYYAYITEI